VFKFENSEELTKAVVSDMAFVAKHGHIFEGCSIQRDDKGQD